MEFNEMPIVALMYDFDKTLSTTDMQNYKLIPNLGIKAPKFWKETNDFAIKNNMDGVLAYMYMILKKSAEQGKPLKRDDFKACGKDIEFYPGVLDWFKNINDFGFEQGVRVEHYIISSGLKEMIEGSPIYDNFKRVYACEFLYDENDVACWPSLAVNYTGKTQFLFRINKQCLDVYDDIGINKVIPREERLVPFRNMIYIGDGISDVPCMQLVKSNGGYSVGVYAECSPNKCKELISDQRVDYIFKADYREGSDLDICIKGIIKNMSIKDNLVKLNLSQRKQFN